MDIDIRGELTKRYENSVWLLPQGSSAEVCLPRDQIAIVEEVHGVTVTLPLKLAFAKKLITEDQFDLQQEVQTQESVFLDTEDF